MDWGANSMPGGGIQLARKKQILILRDIGLAWLELPLSPPKQ
jgi:hypothetical protein